MLEAHTPFIELQAGTIGKAGRILLETVNLSLYPNEPVALSGISGSGKSTLLQVLAGQAPLMGGRITRQIPEREMLVLTPRHHFKNRSNTQDFYYQQRYHSTEVGQAISLQEYYEQINPLGLNTYWTISKVRTLLGLQDLLNKPCIALSNGETRRAMLGAALLKNPSVLLLDDPLVGLDKQRQLAYEGYLQAITASGMQVILTCSPEQIPGLVKRILFIRDGLLIQLPGGDAGIKAMAEQAVSRPVLSFDTKAIQALFPASTRTSYEYIVHMEAVHVRYAGQQVLQDVSWTVRPGECWSLSGPNGAGKSTLLSLINGDNPQAYSNSIVLFDRKRGSGESIWDIKRKIGFVSPELHQYFPFGQRAGQVICSGYFETLGLYRSCSADQLKRARQLSELLGAGALWSQPFQHLSRGQQRICLLIRALVKQPDLLILDEPTQGLDTFQTQDILQIIDVLCRHSGTTLIFVTHQSGILPSTIDHRLTLEKGRVKENTYIKPTYHEHSF